MLVMLSLLTFNLGKMGCALMARARHKKFPVAKLAIVGAIIALIGIVAYFGFATRTSILPTANAKNFSFTIKKTSSGPTFVGVGPGGKKTIATGHNSPTLVVNKGDAVTIHIINEDTGEKHDFVIPELNVHSKVMNYFEADTVTFVADREGEFTYTSTTHPEMKGLIVVR